MSAVAVDPRINSAAFVEATPVALLFSARPYTFWAECADCGFRSADHSEGVRDEFHQDWDSDAAIVAAYAEVERHHGVTHG